MSAIRAIVLDANAFGRGATPNVRTIRQWSRACETHDAELWIPELVAFELAQHAAEEHDRHVVAHDSHRRRLDQWGMPSPGALATVSVADLVQAMADAGAVIVALDETSARSGLFDQVLQTGAGHRKGRVKTGGADSAWIRSVIVANGGDCEGLVVVTGDLQALQATCEQFDVGLPRHAHHLGEVRNLAEDSVTAEEALHDAFIEWVQEHLVRDRSSGTPSSFELTDIADIGGWNWWTTPPIPQDEFEPWELTERFVGPVTAAQVVSAVMHDHWVEALTADVVLQAEVEETYLRRDPFTSGGGGGLSQGSRAYPVEVEVELRLFVESGGTLSFDGVIDDVELPGVAEINVWDDFG